MRNTEKASFAKGLAGRILAYIRQENMIPAGSRVLCAVSGGADSMALLAVLLDLAPQLGCTLEIVHVDHGLRGEASRRDAEFVRQLSRERELPLHLLDARAAGVEYPERPSEDWARNLRYGYFDQLVQQAAGPVCVATAHTLSDQTETLLFRLARGAGVRGAGGIRPVRGAYVRPLLCVTRAEVERYCREQHIVYVTDETNLTDDYVRNRLRHHAMPVLCQSVPGAEQNLGRFCARMQKLDGYFAQKAETLLQTAACPGGWTLEELQRADWPVCEAALLELAGRACQPTDVVLGLLMQMVRQGSGAVQLASGRGLRARRGRLEWFDPNDKPITPPPPQPLREGKYCFPGGFVVQVQVMDCEKFKNFANIHKKDLNYCADYAKIQKNIVLRTQRRGDTYRPRGRGLAKPLRKLYWELGIPPDRRPQLPLAAQDSQVIWLWGQGFADGLEPGPQTRDVLTITISTNNQEETT